MTTYPRSDLDEPAKLVDVLGNMWTELFPDRRQIKALSGSLGQIELSAVDRFQGLLNSLSRFTVDLWQVYAWWPLVLLESELTQEGGVYSWPLPDALVAAPVLCNRITQPSLTLFDNIDYRLTDTTISFRLNLFDRDDVYVIQQTDEDGNIDRVAQLWLQSAASDRDTVYKQFGYAVDLAAPSSAAYKDLINALYDSAVSGTSQRSIDALLGAVTGVPFAGSTETVQAIFDDDLSLWICTDRATYAFNQQSTPIVSVGQVVHAGEALVDTVRVFSLGRGEVPAGLDALTIEEGLLAPGYSGSLTFTDTVVPWVIETDDDGRVRMSFEIQGLAEDVAKFWDAVHAAGLRYGTTLARLLDTREQAYVYHELDSFSDSSHGSLSEVLGDLPEPTEATLPVTVNPLKFLVQHILRNNVFVVRITSATLGANALSLDYLDLLRRVVPPHTLALVVVD